MNDSSGWTVSETLIALIPAVVLLLGLAGLFWLLFKRCRLTVPQLLAAIGFYGSMLGVLQWWLARKGEPETARFAALSVCLALAVALGVFLGARAEAREQEKPRLFRWAVYLSALTLPVTFVPAIVLTVQLTDEQSALRRHPQGILIWLAFILPALVFLTTRLPFKKGG